MFSKNILSGSGYSFGVWTLIYGPGYIKIKTAELFETSVLGTSGRLNRSKILYYSVFGSVWLGSAVSDERILRSFLKMTREVS